MPVPPSPQNILLISHGFPPETQGGTERYVARIARGLTDRGHTVSVMTGSLYGREHSEVSKEEWNGVQVYRIHRAGLFVDHWSKSYAPEVSAALRKLIRQLSPDIVHLHHWIRLSRDLVATAVEERIPTIVTLHDMWSTCPRAFRVREGQFCDRPLSVESCLSCVPRDPWQDDQEVASNLDLFKARFRDEVLRAHRVLVPSESHGSYLKQRLEIEGEHFATLAHGTIADDLAEREPAPPSELWPRPKKFQIAHWGHLQTMKGTEVLLDALACLDEEKRSKIELTLLGAATTDAVQQLLQEKVADLPVRWIEDFTRERLGALKADVAVIPSIARESWSFVLDEAWRLSLPALVSNHGALHERVQATGAGFTFEVGDAQALSKLIAELMDEPDRIHKARQAIPPLNQMALHIDGLEQHYRDVIALGGALSPRVSRTAAEWAERETEARSVLLNQRTQALAFERDLRLQKTQEAKNLEAVVAESKAALEHREKLLADFRNTVATLEELQKTSDARLEERAQRDRSDYIKLQADRDRLLLADRQSSQYLAEAQAGLDQLEQRVQIAERTSADAARSLREDREVVFGLRQELLALRHQLEAEVSAKGNAIERLKASDKHVEDLLAAKASLEEAVESWSKEAESLSQCNEEQLLVMAELRKESEGAQAKQSELQETLESLTAQSYRLKQRLIEIAQTFGVKAPAESLSPLAQAESTLQDLDPILNENRALVSQLASSAEDIAADADVIERERERLANKLHAWESRLSSLRSHVGFRIAERWASRTLPSDDDLESSSMRSNGRHGLTILMVIHDFLPKHAAGSQIYTYRLAEALSKHHRVHLLFTEARPGVHSYHVREGRFAGIPYTEISHQHTTEWFERTYLDPSMERLFSTVIDKVRPDIVHFQHTYHHSIGYIPIAKSRGLPVVYTLHEYMLLCPRGGQMVREDLEICARPIPTQCADCITHLKLGAPPHHEGRAPLTTRVARHLPTSVKDGLKQWIKSEQAPSEASIDANNVAGIEERAAAITQRLEVIGKAAELVDLFISPSQFLREKFIECEMVRPEQIIYSENGQDPSPFLEATRRSYPGLRVGYIGTISEYKGVRVLVQALNELSDEAGIEGHIHGGLTTFPAFSEELQSLSSNPRTQFHGRYDPNEVGAVLSTLDVIVVPSLWYENAPLTIQEAYLSGAPVVASRLGGMIEFVKEGETGLLFEVGNPKDLARVLRKIHDDPELRERLRNVRVPIKTIEDDAREMEERYRSLVSSNSFGESTESESAS